MTTFDRFILCALTLGLWLMLGSNVVDQPIYAQSIDAYDIDGLKRFIRRTVDDCSVSGEVYVYDISGSEGYGEISSATISC